MSTINGCIVFNELMCYNLTTAITKKKKRARMSIQTLTRVSST